MNTLFHIGSEPVNLDDAGRVSFLAALTIDGDGAPTCYGPAGTKPLDFLANAGRPGNWWGIATHSGRPDGAPIVQGTGDPAPGYYVSTTAYKIPGFKNGDPRRELDSGLVPFIVVPHRLLAAVPGVVIGCCARVTDNRTGKSVEAVVGDIGPDNHLGEASMAVAIALGIPSNPKKGGSEARVFLYELWPGVVAPGFRLQPIGKHVAVLDAVKNAVYA